MEVVVNTPDRRENALQMSPRERMSGGLSTSRPLTGYAQDERGELIEGDVQFVENSTVVVALSPMIKQSDMRFHRRGE